MLALLFLSVGADPTFVVVNKCPPAFTVVNKCPAPIAKPARYTNGFNCSAGFCKANGGSGCPSCPNNSAGTCACGVAQPAAVWYTPPVQFCPTGR